MTSTLHIFNVHIDEKGTDACNAGYLHEKQDTVRLDPVGFVVQFRGLKHIKLEHKKEFIGALKNNRLVALSEEDRNTKKECTKQSHLYCHYHRVYDGVSKNQNQDESPFSTVEALPESCSLSVRGATENSGCVTSGNKRNFLPHEYLRRS